MMLGKRPRPPIKRTTSMTEFILDTTAVQSAATAGRNHRRNSVDITDSTHFLRSCSLCNRRLIPGRDIFMYRGDSGFCSLECREEQIIEDERKEKRSLLEKEATATATASDGGGISTCISDQVVVSNNAEAVTAVVM